LSTDTGEKQHHGHICLRQSTVAENWFTTNNASSILSIQSVTVNVISGRHLRLRSIPITWPGLQHIMEILNNLLQDNTTPPHPKTQPTQLPGCHESATSLLPVWPLAILTVCLQFLPSMFLCPLSPDFCHIVSPTTHVPIMAPLSVHLPQLPLAYCYRFLSVQQSLFLCKACSSWTTMMIHVVSSSETLVPTKQST
jgi:hypothetical protein